MSKTFLIEGNLEQVIVLDCSQEMREELTETALETAEELGRDFFAISEEGVVLDDPWFNRDWYVPFGTLPWMNPSLRQVDPIDSE